MFYGGNFTGFNAQSGWSYLVKYTPSTNTWSRVDGASDFNGIVYALAFGADGTLYAGGAFTNAGGDGSADYLCKVVSNNISAVKSGGTGTVYALAYCPLNNSLYFGGSFTDWASNTDIDYAGVYSISADAYAPVATGLISADDVVNGMAVDSRGYVWMVGAFNNAGEAAALGVASVNPSTYAFDYRQTVDITGNRVACDLSRGIVYIGTTTTDYLLGKIVNNVYTNLDPGDVIVDPYDFVSAIQVDSRGDVYLGVTTAAYQGLAIWVWSGGVFRMFDTSLGLVPSVGCGAIAFAPDGTMYMGLSVTGSYYNSGVTTVTNSGSASAYPIIKIKQTGGTAYLFSLYNLTTGRGLYFENYNHFQILNGETITIDIGKRTITSNSRGILLSNLLRNCDLANWTLQPGANIISGFVYNSGATVTATIEWRITHWSADGVAA